MKLISGAKKKERQARVIIRLQAQLKSSVKNTSEGVVELSDKDITRIKREISILEALTT